MDSGDVSTLSLAATCLGRKLPYVSDYNPDLLLAIPRILKRQELGIGVDLPFVGQDLWRAYEISWLAPSGLPQVAWCQLYIPCDSPYLIESKSMKLYFNSFNQTVFESFEQLFEILCADISNRVGAKVSGELLGIEDMRAHHSEKLDGFCLDRLDVSCDCYQPRPDYLCCLDSGGCGEEKLYSHLLKSNCLVTGQPDWGTVWIHYQGSLIDHAGMLRYIVSLREHNEFHEQCVERMFVDIMRACHPQLLTIAACYTRRGGVEINPLRTTHPAEIISMPRLWRQ